MADGPFVNKLLPGSTTEGAAFECGNCGATIDEDNPTNRWPCPECGSAEVVHLHSGGPTRRIKAPWWTFVGMSLVSILLATGSLNLGVVVYYFLFS